MKIVISAQGKDLNTDVDPRFGRAPFFLVYDLEKDDFDAVDNSDAASAGQGAGVQAAQTIVGRGVTALLTGHCGPKAYQLLSASGVAVYTDVAGSVRDAVAGYRSGELRAVAAPDVEGRWK